jgi:hypothetical protein
MPEFQLDYGSPDAARLFKQLDEFTQGYIEAIFFTDASPDSEDLADAKFEELAPATLVDIIGDCLLFEFGGPGDWASRTALDLAYDYACVDYDAHRAGTDYWLTRNHHGAGYWDRGLGEIGRELTELAHAAGSRNLYRGDDNLLYLS